MTDAEKMVAAGSRYQTKTTIVSVLSNVPKQLVEANPLRLYIRFETGPSGFAMPEVLPAPRVGVAMGFAGTRAEKEFKWKDCPSIVIGEFYAYSNLNNEVTVIECCYLGDA